MSESQYHTELTDPVRYPSNGPGLLRQRGARLVYLLLGVLALLLVLQWWSTRTEIRNLRRDMAQRIQSGESVSAESRNIAKSVQDDVKDLQSKVSVLENKQVEGQSQQLALEQMYQELSRNRDDWALAEIEQVLSTASQQLQLAGNVQGALIALQNADARLSRSDKPQFITIRRALSRDIEKLKALPTVDITGIALRLDTLMGQVDAMPLLSDEKPAAPPASRKDKAAQQQPVDTGWLAGLKTKWRDLSADMWNEVRQLVQIRRVDTPESLLLSPGEAYYARENLKLRLLSARLSLLSRNQNAFRSDLAAAQQTILRYFDSRARQTQAALALLKGLQGSDLTIEMPTLNDSLNAVRSYKAKP
jgi:uroporphyrin-3 C-methyltransferase/uroporphyrinogen III methyltransferase/synthase